MLPASSAARVVAERMTTAAHGLLASLDRAQREQVVWPWSAGAERERRRWYYTPTDHGGLPVGAMTPVQYQRAMALVAAGLSEAGYATVATIMGLENVLDSVNGFAGIDFGRARGRDPGLYYLRIFGDPGTRAWGWRFGGHHVSLNNLVVEGELVSVTPCFLGADPACTPLLGSTSLRPLGGMEDLARSLINSLNEEQRSRAVLTTRAPIDIVGANRSHIGPGNRVVPLSDLFRGRLTDPDLNQQMDQIHRETEHYYGLTEDDHAAVQFANVPAGIPASDLEPTQQEQLRAILNCYVGRAPDVLASWHVDRYAGSALDDIHLAWAGRLEPGAACYYRLEGPGILVEYDNAQRQANHAHSVWRNPQGDFGGQALAW